MLREVLPIPDPSNLDLSTIIELTLFLILTFAIGFNFFKVVTTDTFPLSVAVLKLRISRVVIPDPKTNLSAVNSSVVPSDLKTAYLSGSNGRKVSFSPALKVFAILLLAIVWLS